MTRQISILKGNLDRKGTIFKRRDRSSLLKSKSQLDFISKAQNPYRFFNVRCLFGNFKNKTGLPGNSRIHSLHLPLMAGSSNDSVQQLKSSNIKLSTSLSGAAGIPSVIFASRLFPSSVESVSPS